MTRLHALPGLRQAALSGLALAAAVALWWLGSARLALDQGADPARFSARALQALWVLRALAVAVLIAPQLQGVDRAGRAGSLGGHAGWQAGWQAGWYAGAIAAAALVAPAWPLVVLVTSASAVPWLHVLFMETALLAACGMVVGACHVVRLGVLHVLGRACSASNCPVAADVAADVVCRLWGVLLALGLWWVQDPLGQALAGWLAQPRAAGLT